MERQAERLEHVRKEEGYETLKAFWEKLSEGWDEEERLSYDALRSYHRGVKTAPALYFARVAEVFSASGWRLDWLIRGEGPPQQAAGKRHSELLAALGERYPWVAHLDSGVQQSLLDVLRSLEAQATGGHGLEEADGAAVEKERLELASDLVFFLEVPLRSWGFRPGAEEGELLFDDETRSVELQHLGALNSYCHLALAALKTIASDPLQGDRWDERPDSLLPTLRRAAASAVPAALPGPSDEEDERARAAQAAAEELMEQDQRGADKILDSARKGGVLP